MPAVFLSYAHADAEKALRLYSDLTRAGVDVWLDQESLLPGQPWKPAIEKAIRDTRYFVALLSATSVSRRGYVQKELIIALDVLEEFPSEDIFVIPARIEECSPSHHKLRDLHWVDLYPDWDRGVGKILRAIGVPVNQTRSTDRPNLSEGRVLKSQEHPPPLDRRLPDSNQPASGKTPASDTFALFQKREYRRYVQTLLRGLGAMLLGVALIFLLPAICYELWLSTWEGFLSPDKPIQPAITTVFVIGELALASLAGWAASRVKVVPRSVAITLATLTWLAVWIFFLRHASTSLSEVPYFWIVTIAGAGYIVLGGLALGRMRQDLFKFLGGMVALGVLFPAWIWLPQAFAPPPPYVRQEVFSLPSSSSITVSPDGNQFATVSQTDSATNAIMLWNRQPRVLQSSLSMPVYRMRMLHFSPDGRRLIAVGDSGISCFLFSCIGHPVVRIWDVRTNRVETGVSNLDGAARNFTISPDGAILATYGYSSVRVWSIITRTLLMEFPRETKLIEFAPDGKTLAIMPDSTNISLWDVATGKQLKTLNATPSSFTTVSFSPDGLVLGTGALDGSVSTWDPRSGTLRKRMLADTVVGAIRGLVFSSDGRWLASTSDHGIAIQWDVANGSWERRWHADFIAFVPDSKSVVTYDGRAYSLWSIDTGEWKQGIWLPEGFWGGRRPSIEFSANGAVFLTRQDTTVEIWRHRSLSPYPRGG